jgi:hypothetical protein
LQVLQSQIGDDTVLQLRTDGGWKNEVRRKKWVNGLGNEEDGVEVISHGRFGQERIWNGYLMGGARVGEPVYVSQRVSLANVGMLESITGENVLEDRITPSAVAVLRKYFRRLIEGAELTPAIRQLWMNPHPNVIKGYEEKDLEVLNGIYRIHEEVSLAVGWLFAHIKDGGRFKDFSHKELAEIGSVFSAFADDYGRDLGGATEAGHRDFIGGAWYNKPLPYQLHYAANAYNGEVRYFDLRQQV